METIIPVENQDTLNALQGFLRRLLEAGVVEALLVPMRTPGGAVTPALVTTPELLEQADPLAPVLPVNAATWAGKLSAKEPRARIGAVLRSCELRALTELVKLQQASLDSLLLITLDCPGTYNVPNYQKAAKNHTPANFTWKVLYEDAAGQPGTPKAELRTACKICEQPVFQTRPGDIGIHLFGHDTDHEIGIHLPDEIAEKIGVQAVEIASTTRRDQVIEKLVAARVASRDAEFAAIRARLEGDEGIAGVFSACIRCHNCMTACPICYCKTCVFKSAVFDHEPMQFVNWARQKGAYRLPADTMLFHLTRLNHMALSCVGCGMCTEACPAEIPVGIVFRAIGQRVQAAFEYAPGRSLDDPLPLVTFKADEWTEVGE